jgi:uncharacterized membrane protein YdjX (TVP38/TMEM64 family)
MLFVFPVKEWLEPMETWADESGAWGMIALIGLYALAAVLCVPGSLLMIGTGFAFGLAKGVVITWVGATLGATLAFTIARYALRETVEARAHRSAKFRAMNDAIAEHGWKVVALLRLSPIVPYNLSNYLYGVTRVSFPHYVAASALGLLPSTVLHVYVGSLGHMASSKHAAEPWEWALASLGVLATAAVVVWMSRVARRSVRSMPEAPRRAAS